MYLSCISNADRLHAHTVKLHQFRIFLIVSNFANELKTGGWVKNNGVFGTREGYRVKGMFLDVICIKKACVGAGRK